jgi:hypothetical protein
MVQGYQFRPDTQVIFRPKQQMSEQEQYTHWLLDVGGSALEKNGKYSYLNGRRLVLYVG